MNWHPSNTHSTKRKISRASSLSAVSDDILKFNWHGVLKFNWYSVLKSVNTLDQFEDSDNGWSFLEIYASSAQEAHKLYKRLRDLDYTQVDERLTVMLNAILQLEAQGERRESATEAVLMVGYTTEGISNQEQTRLIIERL